MHLSYLALGVDVANVGSDTCAALFSKRPLLNGLAKAVGAYQEQGGYRRERAC